MSRRPAWSCDKCGYQLGEVVCGALRVWVPAPMIGPESTAVTCPRCGQVNVWRHQMQTTTR